jgi:hypothetical protein
VALAPAGRGVAAMVTRAARWRGGRAALRAVLVGALVVAATPALGQSSALPRPASTSVPVAGAWDSPEGRARVVDALVALFAAEYHAP